MSSTGTIADHPVVAGIRDAVDDPDPSGVGPVWQLFDDEVETALDGLIDLSSRVAALEC